MSAFTHTKVLSVRHWNDKLFSFQVERDKSFRFRNGEFVMIGLEVDGKPLVRAYSIASSNYEENLEFLSIKVEDGALTSRLQHIQPGDSLLISKKPTGTLVIDDLSPAENLYLIATGTGVVAPFRSILLDLEVWQRFKRVVLFQGVRRISDLAYYSLFHDEIKQHPYVGELAREQFYYYPSVTREEFGVQKRITHLVESGQIFNDLDIAPAARKDVVMLCGNQAMLDQMQQLLISQGFNGSPKMGVPGDYVIEKAFVDK